MHIVQILNLFLYKVSILFHMKPIENDCKCMQTIHVGWTDSGASGMYTQEKEQEMEEEEEEEE